MVKGRTHVAFYGNVKVVRHYDPSTRGYTIGDWSEDLDGVLHYGRMSQPEQMRRLPPLDERRQMLINQEHRCLYCLRPFGGYVYRNGRAVRLKLHWDHMVPFVYLQNNEQTNFAAACQVCNGVKGSRCYRTIEEARIDIDTRRKAKGYQDAEDV